VLMGSDSPNVGLLVALMRLPVLPVCQAFQPYRGFSLPKGGGECMVIDMNYARNNDRGKRWKFAPFVPDSGDVICQDEAFNV
jgi:hypothetical protein